jgi:hypothetical protein
MSIGVGHTDRSRPGDLCWLEERGRNPRGILPAVVRFDPPGPWAQSTSGSAPRLQRDACRFEPGWVHHAGVAEMEDAPGSDPGGLTPLRVRPSPPAPGASSSVVERWTLNPCRRGFEPLGAHSAGIIRSQHLVVAQFGQSTRFGTGGSAVRVRSTRPAVIQHRTFGSGPAVRTLGSGPRDGGSNPSSRAPERPRRMPHRAAVAQSGERRPVKAEATGSKPVCGAKPWW